VAEAANRACTPNISTFMLFYSGNVSREDVHEEHQRHLCTFTSALVPELPKQLIDLLTPQAPDTGL